MEYGYSMNSEFEDKAHVYESVFWIVQDFLEKMEQDGYLGP